MKYWIITTKCADHNGVTFYLSALFCDFDKQKKHRTKKSIITSTSCVCNKFVVVSYMSISFIWKPWRIFVRRKNQTQFVMCLYIFLTSCSLLRWENVKLLCESRWIELNEISILFLRNMNANPCERLNIVQIAGTTIVHFKFKFC